MPFVRTLREYRSVEHRIVEHFYNGCRLPRQVFRGTPRVRFVDFDELFSSALWSAMAEHGSGSTDELVGSVLEPSPIAYWAEHFDHYGSFISPLAHAATELPALFAVEPSSSPADSIRLNGRCIAVVNVNGTIRVWAESARELAAIAAPDALDPILERFGLRVFAAEAALEATRSTFVDGMVDAQFRTQFLMNYGGR